MNQELVAWEVDGTLPDHHIGNDTAVNGSELSPINHYYMKFDMPALCFHHFNMGVNDIVAPAKHFSQTATVTCKVDCRSDMHQAQTPPGGLMQGHADRHGLVCNELAVNFQ